MDNVVFEILVQPFLTAVMLGHNVSEMDQPEGIRENNKHFLSTLATSDYCHPFRNITV
jgi:hypothetical protein